MSRVLFSVNESAFDTEQLLLLEVFLPDAFAKIKFQECSVRIEYEEPANLISCSVMMVRDAHLVSVINVYNVLQN